MIRFRVHGQEAKPNVFGFEFKHVGYFFISYSEKKIIVKFKE